MREELLALADRVEMEEASTEEICKILAVTPTNLWTVLHRARARLRACLEQRYFGRSPKGRR